MSKCHVPKCNSKISHNKTNPPISGDPLTFHRFPSNEALKKQWLKFLGQNLKTNTHNLFICCKHFNVSDFIEPTLPISPKQRRRLKAGAVPSVRNPQNSKTSKHQRGQKNVSARIGFGGQSASQCGNDSGVSMDDSLLDDSGHYSSGGFASDATPEMTSCEANEMKMRIQELEEQLRKRDQTISVLQEQNIQAKKRVADLEKLSLDLKDVQENQIIAKSREMLSSKLTKNQTDLLLGIKKRVNWSSEELSRGFYFAIVRFAWL
ncbi:THAP domain-containing protein 2-like [Armigeres subalbatus]|uniref:THAP domain-containing protein 2-like n=1 Tax=Armigeres subalbatus TaxID=124917 RepID=UPI002ED3A408